NPIAMLKRVPSWEESCRLYSDNLILEEKYTQASYIADVESTVYGAYISGYCGNFGIRYDETGWTDSTWSGTGVSSKDQYRLSTGLPIHLERMALNGATVIDGPELVWADDFKELWPSADSEGYTTRKWDMYDQYQNTVIDMFRKVQDGTIRIPDRKEVIERTKVVIIQDVNSGSNDDKYSTYPSLLKGFIVCPE
ncbi:glycosyl hydrolase family 98, partial [human gut metagenome]